MRKTIQATKQATIKPRRDPALSDDKIAARRAAEHIVRVQFKIVDEDDRDFQCLFRLPPPSRKPLRDKVSSFVFDKPELNLEDGIEWATRQFEDGCGVFILVKRDHGEGEGCYATTGGFRDIGDFRDFVRKMEEIKTSGAELILGSLAQRMKNAGLYCDVVVYGWGGRLRDGIRPRAAYALCWFFESKEYVDFHEDGIASLVALLAKQFGTTKDEAKKALGELSELDNSIADLEGRGNDR